MNPQVVAYIQTGVALAFQLVAIVNWSRMFRRIRPWNWWCCFLGLVLIVTHRVAELLGHASIGHATSIPIAVGFAYVTYMANRAVTADERRAALMKIIEEQKAVLETQVQQQRGAATALAAILSDLKSRIEYYEDLAAKHGLPKYEAPAPEEFPEI